MAPFKDFEPAHFLRCHSKKNDNADVQTQVWMCQFEPDAQDGGKTTNMVATCGGNSVCFIDVRTGKVVAKYEPKDVREMLYTLSWTTWPGAEGGGATNVLATAGVRNTVHFIQPHPPHAICFLTTATFSTRSSIRIQALLFLPHDPYKLIIGSSNGDVRVARLVVQRGGGGVWWEEEGACAMEVLQQLSTESEIFSLAFCTVTRVLLAGCNDGLIGLKFHKKEDRSGGELLRFTMPVVGDDEAGGRETELVDSVEMVGGEGVVASKCALHPAVYVWHLPTALAHNCTVSPSHLLHYSDTDNYFMYLGLHTKCGLLCCGDDVGALWLYDISSLDWQQKQLRPVGVEPIAIYPWPHLSDASTEKKRKLNLDVYDIVIDKVTINHDGTCIVAVTNNNLVCIWRR